MIRTYNNVPISVKTPSSDDIKNYFFNHVNWKGVNEDKNVLDIDQETFQDAKNVYMDTDAVLKSRPSIKKENLIDVATLVGKDYSISDVWTYGNVVVYVTHIATPSTYRLVFVNNDKIYKSYTYNWTEAPKGVLADNKIFVFTPNYLYYYDIANNTWYLADDDDNKIYIPVTKVIVNGVESSAATVDSPNELTESHIIRYLYDNFNVATFDDFIGEQVTIKIDGKSYLITFVKNNQLVFVGKAFSLNEFNIADDKVYGISGINIPYVQTSSAGNYILSSYSYTLDNNKVPHGQWSIYHSVDGKIFNLLPILDNIIAPPILSENGAFVIVFKDDGPYIYSVLATEAVDGSLKRTYQKWTNLMLELKWTGSELHLNQIYSSDFYKSTVLIDGYFVNDTQFAFVYGNINSDGDAVEQELNIVVYCNNTFITKTISRPTSSGHYRLNTMTRPLIKMATIPERFSSNGAILSTRYSIAILSVWIYYTNNNVKTQQYTDLYHVEITNNTSILERINITTSDFNSSGILETITDVPIRCDIQINITNHKVAYRTAPPAPEFGSDTQYTAYELTIPIDDSGKYTTNTTLIAFATGIIPGTKPLYSGFKYLYPSGYLLTEYGLYPTNDLTDYALDKQDRLLPIPLLFDAFPLKSYYAGNQTDALYLATTEGVYSSNFSGQLEIDKLISGDTKLFVPDADSQLDNYYFSKNNSLYISKLVDSEDFKWYFPKINTQVFDDNITNLHPIAEDTMAIFFTDSVYRCVWDSDVSAYRYYKTRIQVGCRKGSDVLTTFDGKYTMFASDRGLVAMSYQDFIASTEQSLTYVSDTIYQRFLKFSDNAGVKLYKYSYWIFAYKLDTKECYVYDIRNNSWWPFELQHNPTKFVTIDNEVKLLSKGNMHRFDTSDTKYYDYDGKTQAKIEWFILSQKLHLNALNNYKHIVNMTFVSLHDERILAQGNYIDDNQRDFDFKLQTAIYRKRLDSNIDSENDYVSVNYEIEVIRTFVQRLNFSKVCEFQYKLSYDPENAIEIPLSLNSITVKYKVGGQVR